MYAIAAQPAITARISARWARGGYCWDARHRPEYINGPAAPHTGVSETARSSAPSDPERRRPTTSAISAGPDADLRPGQWLHFSSAQIADLNNGQRWHRRIPGQGNVYNAQLHGANPVAGQLVIPAAARRHRRQPGRQRILRRRGNDFINPAPATDIISGGAVATRIFGEGRCSCATCWRISTAMSWRIWAAQRGANPRIRAVRAFHLPVRPGFVLVAWLALVRAARRLSPGGDS